MPIDLSDGHEETFNIASGGDMTPTVNTFSGGITVSASAVQANHPSAFGTGDITVSSSSGQIPGGVRIESEGAVSCGTRARRSNICFR